MKLLTFLSALAITSLLFFSSCEKESDSFLPGPPGPPQNAAVNSVALTGGSVIGNWRLKYYQNVRFRNDTFDFIDTMLYQPGDINLGFYVDGSMTYDEQSNVSTGTFLVSSNNLNYTINSFTESRKYGLSGANVLRLHDTVSGYVLGNHYRWQLDYLFERY